MIPSGNFILQTYGNENAFYTFTQKINKQKTVSNPLTKLKKKLELMMQIIT